MSSDPSLPFTSSSHFPSHLHPYTPIPNSVGPSAHYILGQHPTAAALPISAGTSGSIYSPTISAVPAHPPSSFPPVPSHPAFPLPDGLRGFGITSTPQYQQYVRQFEQLRQQQAAIGNPPMQPPQPSDLPKTREQLLQEEQHQQPDLGHFIIFTLSPACIDPVTGLLTQKNPIPLRPGSQVLYLPPLLNNPAAPGQLVGEMAQSVQQLLAVFTAAGATAVPFAPPPSQVLTTPVVQAAQLQTQKMGEEVRNSVLNKKNRDDITPLDDHTMRIHSRLPLEKDDRREMKTEGTTTCLIKSGKDTMRRPPLRVSKIEIATERKMNEEREEKEENDDMMRSLTASSTCPPATTNDCSEREMEVPSIPRTISPSSSLQHPPSLSLPPPSFQPIATSTPACKGVVVRKKDKLPPLPSLPVPISKSIEEVKEKEKNPPTSPSFIPIESVKLDMRPLPHVNVREGKGRGKPVFATPRNPRPSLLEPLPSSIAPTPTKRRRSRQEVASPQRDRSRSPIPSLRLSCTGLLATPMGKQETPSTSSDTPHVFLPRRGRPPGSLNKKTLSSMKKKEGKATAAQTRPMRESTRLASLKKAKEVKAGKMEGGEAQELSYVKDKLLNFYVKHVVNGSQSEEEMIKRGEEALKVLQNHGFKKDGNEQIKN